MKKHVTITCVAIIGLAVALAGCATGGKKLSPEELVMQQTQAFTNDFLAANVDNFLNYISDSFTNDRVQSKAEIAEHIKTAKEKGRVAEGAQWIKDNNGKIDLANAKVTVTGDKATVYPIVASADMGSVTVELTFVKDPDKVWRICGINVEGV